MRDVNDLNWDCCRSRPQQIHETIVITSSKRCRSFAVDSVTADDWAAVVAAIVESICLEIGEPIPVWTAVSSRAPIFIPQVHPDSTGAEYLKRVSPEPFRRRNIYVTENILTCE